jgi:toxin ParE1/3/4
MKIVWTKFAREDLKAIRDYIARDSNFYAAQFGLRLVNAVNVLRRFPELGEVVPEFQRYVVRQRIVQNYRVLYTIEKNRVVVLSIIHAARDIGSISLPERS